MPARSTWVPRVKVMAPALWRWTVGAIVAVACLLSLAVTRGRPGVGYDSVFYWSAANTLRQEGALATGVLHDERLARLGNPEGRPAEPGEAVGQPPSLHPFTAWPPGYPLTVAAVGAATGTSTLTAALIINIVALALLVMAAAFLGHALAGPRAGILSAAGCAVWPVIQAATRMVWSDTLFVALVALTLAVVVRWLDDPGTRGRYGWLAVASVLAGAATLVRYPGVTLALLIAVAGGWRAFTKRSWTDVIATVLALAAVGGMVAPVAWRNLQLSGDVGGAARLPAEELAASMRAVAVSLVDLIPIVRNPWAGPVDSVLSAAAIAAVFAAVWVRFRGRGSALGPWQSGVAWLLAGYACIFVLFITVLRARSIFDTDGRIFLPALLCALVIGGGWVARRLPEPALRPVLVACLVMASAVTVIDTAREDWRGFHRPLDRQEPVRRWVIDHLTGEPQQPVWLFTDHVEMMHFFTGRPVHRLPARENLQALQEGAPAGGLVVVVPAGSFWFPGAAAQADYERELAVRAAERYQGEGFVVYWLNRKTKGS